ncbi:DUF1501 domain-containing protein [Rubinisphaera sp.]|uniref:DUF1501 domain-containing protein n=1 Tax=Rubinisphaera sp. TaxID=2024857 RepID=UPI000C10E161|nr:DUF1501 domain-containing protein [Rubinisphaera sp.]MBV09809.1 sulfatase [Rubinisphaera sp.]HCS54836.1 DUF1501 domain-containing protein [Planctomycetaceae bacterium]|tara:strand:+ start:145 stop:1590 length:1446 start_codon:yes stop_codon:yes gene_type:complete
MEHANQIPMTRRDVLQKTACGFGGLALASLCAQNSATAAKTSGSLQSKKDPHHPPRAKRIIFLFMQGGPSQVDTFDYKPALEKNHGKSFNFNDARTIAKTGKRGTSQHVMKSPWEFRQYGESGRAASDLFPETAGNMDDLTFVHSMHTDGVAHGPATLFLHCGSTNFVRPSFGSWVNYGLGSENENLPGFISLSPSTGNGGPRNYGNAFLPAIYQGTAIGNASKAIKEATLRNLSNANLSPTQQRRQLEFLQSLNQEQLGSHSQNSELEAVINSFELAWRMQNNVPDVLDLNQETKETLDMYGIGEKETDDYGRQCLMARRLCESGVRFIQVNYGDNSANPAWDQHSNLPKHEQHARAVDKPIGALLQDLKQRGLLEDTIVWWSGEFGRTPYSQSNGTGRDHNPGGFTTWLAGDCVKSGFSYGATDELGSAAVENKVHMHDLHATLLHLLGLDHEKLTYRYAGRNFRLTDVHGHVVESIIS